MNIMKKYPLVAAATLFCSFAAVSSSAQSALFIYDDGSGGPDAGVTLDSTNFQDDVNFDGQVDVGDTTIMRNNSGHSLP
jgi:hypothetical protein